MLKKKGLWIIIFIFLILLITLLYLYNNSQSIISQSIIQPNSDPNDLNRDQDLNLTGTNSYLNSNFLWFLPKWKNIDTESECNHDENAPSIFIIENDKRYILDKNDDKHLVYTDVSGHNYIINRKNKKQFGFDESENPIIKYKKRKLCKHGHVIRSKNSPNANNILKSYNDAKDRGYLTLGDFNGTTIQEGFSYSALVAPFDSTNLVADACNNSVYIQQLGQYANNAANANDSAAIHFQCRNTCSNDSGWTQTHCWTVGASQCSALQIANNSSNYPLYNISFSDPVNGYNSITDPSNSYQIMCSQYGAYANGGTQFANSDYAFNAYPINDCLYNQRTSVNEMCQVAQNTYNTYSNNLPNNNTFQQTITANSAYGSLTGGYWAPSSPQAINTYTNPSQYIQNPTQEQIMNAVATGTFANTFSCTNDYGIYQGNCNYNVPDPSYNPSYAVGATVPGQTIQNPIGGSSAWTASSATVSQILSSLNTAWTNCNSTNNQILQQAFDDCSNPNTLIDSSGMINCNGGVLQQAYITRNETCAAAMTAATNTNDTNSQAKITSWWTDFDPSNNPFTTTYNTAAQNFPTETGNCFAIYNDCNNQGTFLDSNGLTQCLGTQYSQAQNSCQSALGLATQNGDEAGWTTINNMWNDVSNNKLTGYGNTLQNVQIALTTAQSTCQKQIEMYNIWQADIDEAKHEPCIPEQPVISQGDIDLGNANAQWSATALQYIQSLAERVAVIQQYISNYPPPTGIVSETSILTLDPKNVTLLSTIGTPIFTITQGSTILATTGKPTGLAPVQSLKITLPAGPAGPQGIQGKVGPIGQPGSIGKDGPVGAPGQYEIPEQYYKAISNA